jgi:hypothetical protein
MDGGVLGEGTHLMLTLTMIVLYPMETEGIILLGTVKCATFIVLAPLLSEMVAPQVEIATVCTVVLEYHMHHLLDHVCTILLVLLVAVNGKMNILPLHL